MKIINFNQKKKNVLTKILFGFLFIILCVLSTSLCSNQVISALHRSLVKNDTVSLFINEKDAESLSAVGVEGKNSEHFVAYNFKIGKNWQQKILNINIKNSGGDEQYKILLSGPKKHYPIVVDFRNIKINGKIIESKEFSAWFAKPFEIKIDSNILNNHKHDKTIELSFEARKYHYKSGDLKNIFEFNLYIFVSLLFLIYALLFVIFKNRKIFENYFNRYFIKKPNFIFLFIVIGIAVLPLFKINNDEISIQENRRLAEPTKLYTESGINNNFGKEFDSWLNDRFFCRNAYLHMSIAKDLIFNRIVQNQRVIYDKKSGWFFGKSYSKDYSKEFSEIVLNIQQINNFCKKNSIKFYLLITPEKQDVYREFLLKINAVKDTQDFLLNSSIHDLQALFSNSVIIYPRDALIRAKKNDFVFFMSDGHWTEWGAYNAYSELINILNHDGFDIPKENLNSYNIMLDKRVCYSFERDFFIGGEAVALGMHDDFFLDKEYKFYSNIKKIQEKRLKYTKIFYNTSNKLKYKLFLTGTSMNDNMLPFLPYSFKELKYIRLNNGQLSEFEQFKFIKYYKKELLEFKPDIFVLCVHPSQLWMVLKDFFKD